jgi:uncharacterized protein (DUF1330 family)
MPGYFMGMVHGVNDPEAFGAYQGVAEPTIEQYGGNMVFFNQQIEDGNGDWSPLGIVLFEFESAAKARKWYNSPKYQAVIGQRISSTDSNTVFIDVD